MTIKLNLEHADLLSSEMDGSREKLEAVYNILKNGSGPGNDFLGWMNLPSSISDEQIRSINVAADHIKTADALVVVGIGGSYLGARAVIESLLPNFYNSYAQKKGGTEIYFLGHNLSGNYIEDLLKNLEGKSIMVNVISKSGTTTEPAIAFRIIREWMEKRYDEEELKNRIIVTTDKSRGALKHLADKNSYKSFVIPDDVGGRYSVLTPVGLLPIAVAGINISNLISGARQMEEHINETGFDNDCYKYALVRNIFYNRGMKIELMASYEPKMQYMIEWYKQLFGESEGKEGKGLFPASATFTTDLHSLGQYIQDGSRLLFETNIKVKANESELNIPYDEEDIDSLNYIAGKSVDFVNEKAAEGTVQAHVDGGVPVIIIEMDKLDEYHIGSLIYFMEKSCAVSGYMLGVNPFDQPGVEAYKKNMFRLLGKI